MKKFEGRGREPFVSVASPPSDKALREMLGLFFPYQVDMHQLAGFLTAKNHAWFHSPDGYCFKRVFPIR